MAVVTDATLATYAIPATIAVAACVTMQIIPAITVLQATVQTPAIARIHLAAQVRGLVRH